MEVTMTTLDKLNKLGFAYSTKGTHYLAYIIDNFEILVDMKHYYQQASEFFGVTEICIERDIRTALKVAYRYKKLQKTTTKKFIYDYIMGVFNNEFE